MTTHETITPALMSGLKIYVVICGRDGSVMESTVSTSEQRSKQLLVSSWLYNFKIDSVDVMHVWWIFEKNGYRIKELTIDKEQS